MLTLSETAALAPLAAELVAAITDAKADDSSRGRKISRREARKIAKLSFQLGYRILVDVLD